MTRMACEESVLKRESAFVSALESTDGYRIEGGVLELRMGPRVLARLRAGAEPLE